MKHVDMELAFSTTLDMVACLAGFNAIPGML